jgi:hypothetical protein
VASFVPFEAPLRAAASQRKQGELRIVDERADIRLSGTKKCFHFRSATVAQPHPDDLRRVAAQEAALAKVVVLGDDHELIGRRSSPDFFVAGRVEVPVT